MDDIVEGLKSGYNTKSVWVDQDSRVYYERVGEAKIVNYTTYLDKQPWPDSIKSRQTTVTDPIKSHILTNNHDPFISYKSPLISFI